jgi:FAD binding domain-containing protein/berberine-like enzyme
MGGTVSNQGRAAANGGMNPKQLEELKSALRGQLLGPGDEGYEAARRIHNGMIDRRPAMIVRCAGAADVMRAVKFARERELLVSVRGGGHGIAGFAVCDGGMMIDLSQMKSVRVDPGARTARAEGGATWGDFDGETLAFGLATTGGVARPTGIAGLTVAGGHGYLVRRFGLSCDNLISADVVTADGRMLKASASENSDLFWAVRGGGGNFGIITSFEYRLHPIGPVLGGLVFYPLNKAAGFLRKYDDLMANAPDELGGAAVLGTLPDGTKALVGLPGWSGPIDEGERLLRPLRTHGPPIVDQIGPMPYAALQAIVEKFNPRGMRNYWKTHYMNGLSDEAIQALLQHYESVPSPLSHAVVYAVGGGAASRVGDDETAVAYRNMRFALVLISMWENPADDERNIGWLRNCWQAMKPFAAGGFYINYETDAEADEVKAAYGPRKYDRLAAIKKKYDPTNLFRLNQNIKPAG